MNDYRETATKATERLRRQLPTFDARLATEQTERKLAPVGATYDEYAEPRARWYENMTDEQRRNWCLTYRQWFEDAQAALAAATDAVNDSLRVAVEDARQAVGRDHARMIAVVRAVNDAHRAGRKTVKIDDLIAVFDAAIDDTEKAGK